MLRLTLPEAFCLESRLAPEVKFVLSLFLVKRATSISVSLAFGPHSCASRVNDTTGGWPSGSTVFFLVGYVEERPW